MMWEKFWPMNVQKLLKIAQYCNFLMVEEQWPGGGGGHFHIVHIGYVSFLRPTFSALNYPFQSILFSETKKKIRSIASPFESFFRSGDHPFQNFFTFKPFRRHPRPVYCGQSGRKAFGHCRWVTAGQSASQMRPTSQLQRPPISCSSPLQSPAFSCSTARAALEPPIFQFAVAHTFFFLLFFLSNDRIYSVFLEASIIIQGCMNWYKVNSIYKAITMMFTL